MHTITTIIQKHTQPNWPRTTLQLQHHQPILITIQHHLTNQQTNLNQQHALNGTFNQLTKQQIITKLTNFILTQYTLIQQTLNKITK